MKEDRGQVNMVWCSICKRVIRTAKKPLFLSKVDFNEKVFSIFLKFPFC